MWKSLDTPHVFVIKAKLLAGVEAWKWVKKDQLWWIPVRADVFNVREDLGFDLSCLNTNGVQEQLWLLLLGYEHITTTNKVIYCWDCVSCYVKMWDNRQKTEKQI